MLLAASGTQYVPQHHDMLQGVTQPRSKPEVAPATFGFVERAERWNSRACMVTATMTHASALFGCKLNVAHSDSGMFAAADRLLCSANSGVCGEQRSPWYVGLPHWIWSTLWDIIITHCMVQVCSCRQRPWTWFASMAEQSLQNLFWWKSMQNPHRTCTLSSSSSQNSWIAHNHTAAAMFSYKLLAWLSHNVAQCLHCNRLPGWLLYHTSIWLWSSTHYFQFSFFGLVCMTM